MLKRIALPLLVYLSGACCAQGASDPLSIEEVLRLNRLVDVAAAPQGELVAYTVQSADPAAGTIQGSLFLLDARGRSSTPRLLAEGVEAGSAAWSSDGTYLYFLSARSGSSQVWRVPTSGGDPAQITSLPLPVANLKVSPRGDRLFFTMSVIRHCLELECTAGALSGANAEGSGRYYDRLYVRRWNERWDGRRSQLFTLALSKEGRPTGAPIKLSIDLEGSVPARPSGGREDYTISPDGQHVIFSEQIGGSHEPWFTQIHLYEVPANGGTRRANGAPEKDAEPRLLTPENRGYCLEPAFSPDGSQIAYLAAERPNDDSAGRHLELLTLATGEHHAFIPVSWDESIDQFTWSTDGKSVLATGDHLGQHVLWRLDARTGKATPLSSEGDVERVSAGLKRVFFSLSTLSSPPELYQLGASGHPERLTALNSDRLTDRPLAQVEAVSFAGWNHERVHGYLLKPAEFAENKKFPLAVLVHDGPHASLGNRWDWNMNSQLFAAGGLAVLLIDFHGSTGYGQAFSNSIVGDWGGKALEDLTSGVDSTLQGHDWLNPARVCVVGAGYGGYLVNFIEGHAPARFRCLVSHAGILDTRAAYYGTDELSIFESELKGAAFDNPSGYGQQNPIERVSEWQTPILFTHGELDYRFPYSEGIAAFSAAQRRNVYSALLLFPDEGHLIEGPKNAAQWYHKTLWWVQVLGGVETYRAPAKRKKPQ
jgi:dipeptidyl aminopeptidase/acylaminoacyl peptidase